ncbi:MAG: helix-turn-helix transcriptional regulator, partial [Mesorhizobium sp.]
MTENQPKKPSKSDRTRAQILEAARLLFAEHGYDGASIRDVAAHASIDPAMVIRYFRSKD